MNNAHPILIVTADHIQATLIQKALVEANFRVVVTERGESALALLVQIVPALVLLDWNLPDMSALSVTRVIRSRPGFDRVPVVLTGLKIGTEDKILALEVGVDYFFDGAINPRELTARVRALLRRAEET